MKKKKSYTPLLNGCFRTEIDVHPNNWHTQKAIISKKGKSVEWYIWYRFHDPVFKDKHPDGKLVKRRGMNKFMDLASRQAATEELIEMEKTRLDQEHYNPISEKHMQPPVVVEVVKTNRPVTPATGLIPALDWGYENMKRAPGTLDHIRYSLAAFWQASERLGLENKPIGFTERADIRLILDEIGRLKGEAWTDSGFNYYKGHIGMIFSFLSEYDVYKVNPSLGIKKKTVITEAREILTDEQWNKVNKELKALDYEFWRFIHIFKESGCRRPELLGVQYQHVDLSNRRFHSFVKKDKVYKWVWKDIDSNVFHLWQEIMKEAEFVREGDPSSELPLFLFSEGLRPQLREKPILPGQVTKRWRIKVKKNMDIKADFYALKHRRTTRDIDRMVDAAIKKARHKAARKNSHTTTAMVDKVYDVNTERRAAIIRKLKYQKRKKAVVVRHGKSA